MRFASLGSGSKGNATLVQAGQTLIMIDCGFSVRETTRRLARLGIEPAAINGILVTHEHSDHCAGVASFSRKHNTPVYLTHGTHSSGRCDGGVSYHLFNNQQAFSIGEMEIVPVAVPHDAREPCQYRMSYQGISLGVLTDLGSVTANVVASFRGCDGLLLEFNHDSGMLASGSYPYPLKQRVGGDWGHLNNHQAAALLEAIAEDNLRHLVVAHISEKNNTKAMAEQAMSTVWRGSDKVTWADQSDGFDWLSLI